MEQAFVEDRDFFNYLARCASIWIIGVWIKVTYFGVEIIIWFTYRGMPLYSSIRGTCDVKGMSFNARGYGMLN